MKRNIFEEWDKEREIRDSKFPHKQLNKIFPNGIFLYNAAHAFSHPRIIFDGIANEIKWAWQRVFRGWDDRVVWSVDMFLIPKIPVWLKKLKKDKRGIPMCAFLDEEWDQKTGKFVDGAEEAAALRYEKILDEIIEGCELYDDGDFFNRPEDKKKFDRAMQLFVEYLGTFWD